MWKSLLLIVTASSITIMSQIFLKKGLGIIGGIRISGFYDLFLVVAAFFQNKFIIIGVIIAAIGAFFWLLVISKLDLTTAFPLGGGIFYILLFLISWFFLGEAITPWKIVGTVVILLGLFLISR